MVALCFSKVLIAALCVTVCSGFAPRFSRATLHRAGSMRWCSPSASKLLNVADVQRPAMLTWLQDWSRRSGDASGIAGVPQTYLPATCAQEEDGITFTYSGIQGCTLKLQVNPNQQVGSAIAVLPTIPNNAPQDVVRFVRESNTAITEKLEKDLRRFSEITSFFKPGPAVLPSKLQTSSPPSGGFVQEQPTLRSQLQRQNNRTPREVTTMQPKQLATKVSAFAGWLKKQGFANALQAEQSKAYTNDLPLTTPTFESLQRGDGRDVTDQLFGVNTTRQLLQDPDLRALFEQGTKLSEERWRDVAFTQQVDEGHAEITIPINGSDPRADREGVLDIFAGPEVFAKMAEAQSAVPSEETRLTTAQLQGDHSFAPDPGQVEEDKLRMVALFTELNSTAEEYHHDVLLRHPELMLSDNIIHLLSTVNRTVVNPAARMLFSKMAFHAYELREEYRKAVREAEMIHLRLLQAICRAALGTEEQFVDAMQYLRGDLSPQFLSYLEFAITQEQARLKQKGKDLVPESTVWLNLLRLIHKGSSAELAKRISYEAEALTMVLRYPDRTFRYEFLKKIVEELPELQMARFRHAADRLIENVLNEGPTGLIEPAMFPRIKDLKEDLDRLLPYHLIDEKIAALLKDAVARGEDISRATHLLAQDEVVSADLLYEKMMKERGRSELFSSFL